MNDYKRVKQMAHLKQKQISDSTCKSIVVDTILESLKPLTRRELAEKITDVFHILVSQERLRQVVESLLADNVVFLDTEDRIRLNPVKESEYQQAKAEEDQLRRQATRLWLEHISSYGEISKLLREALWKALPIFLRSFFIKHGVSSYEILTAQDSEFDVKQIAANVAAQFDTELQKDIEIYLPTIFQMTSEASVIEYLKLNINKAVGYISEVISDENLAQITEGLKNLTVYLDTNTIYRLLHLQGDVRYAAVKETIDFCRTSGVKLRISALTKKELTSRLQFDAKILGEYPVRTDLSQVGYKYRTTENYVSTYWAQSQKTLVSVDDFVSYYRNFDVLLEAENVEIETVEVDEERLIDHAKEIYSKLSSRDRDYRKGDFTLWHDAYNFAYVQKQQKVSAVTAIDAGCLFLTTDKSLTTLQREDHELRNKAPVVIAPSQLLQLFSFSKPDSGYEETFIKFFASASLGVTFKYNNNDIQEILSRIGHYSGTGVETAEKILERELINSRYFDAKTELEKEEIIYNDISDELLKELNLTREEVKALRTQRSQLNKDCETALDMLEKNEEEYLKGQERLKEKLNAANLEKEDEVRKREEAERLNEAQLRQYGLEMWRKWKTKHLIMLWVSIIAIFAVVISSIVCCIIWHNAAWLGLLALLAIPIAVLPSASKVRAPGAEGEITKKFLDDYKRNIERTTGIKM